MDYHTFSIVKLVFILLYSIVPSLDSIFFKLLSRGRKEDENQDKQAGKIGGKDGIVSSTPEIKTISADEMINYINSFNNIYFLN